MLKTINILGSLYEIKTKKYTDDEYFKRNESCGYCSGYTHEIVICDMHTYPDWEYEPEAVVAGQQKETLRHEIVHAFLNESGLSTSSNTAEAWARNEEIVDWIAIQGPKIYAAWANVGAI